MTITGDENTKKKYEERELGNDRWYSQMGQAGTGWNRLEYVGQVGQGQGGLHTGWDRMGLRHGGIQIRWDRVGQWTGLCPDEPVHVSQRLTNLKWDYKNVFFLFLWSYFT